VKVLQRKDRGRGDEKEVYVSARIARNQLNHGTSDIRGKITLTRKSEQYEEKHKKREEIGKSSVDSQGRAERKDLGETRAHARVGEDDKAR